LDLIGFQTAAASGPRRDCQGPGWRWYRAIWPGNGG
jgi:hypothetical protein